MVKIGEKQGNGGSRGPAGRLELWPLLDQIQTLPAIEVPPECC